MIAYIFATCIPGEESDAISKIKKLHNVTEVNGIMGRYDIFVKVSTKKEEDLHASITNIRDVQSITSTVTFATIKGQGGSIDDEK
ncbi:MAG: Lrp/AsnC ligand binding domain-containing protein [Thaumarchaeota archaeon]|nr:Lrp/AsnC ligand binding domain-containing protein [Nitrososphaerota archaeon]